MEFMRRMKRECAVCTALGSLGNAAGEEEDVYEKNYR